MQWSLVEKNALVCGSSQGIGRAAAEVLAQMGATVTLLARNRERLEQVAQGLERSHDQHHKILVADFQDPHHVQQAVADYLQQHSGFHVLVNNTGGPPPGAALPATPDQFLDAFRSHLICNQLLVQLVVPAMEQYQYGRIVNVISTSVRQPIAGLGVSNTIRGAVASWAKTLAMELGPRNITVNNVLPGFTDTGRLRSLLQGRADREGKSLDEVIAAAEADIPLRRLGQPAEIAAAIAFFASPLASYISGVSLAVDGGRTQCL